MIGPDIAWQPSLLDGGAVGFDDTFAGMQRRELTEGAWVDHRPGWCIGSDELFARLLAETPWRGRSVHMYDRVVVEPRLTHRWVLGDGPAPPTELQEMAEALSSRYDVWFTQIGVNLYRDGADSVAWHADRELRELDDTRIAILTLGAPRPFLIRPKGGGKSRNLGPAAGDVIVMGGACQLRWEHAVPKTKASGPRISCSWRWTRKR